jgi:hypothetical protein
MSEDARDLDASEPLPPELEALHYRLLADGAAWRERLPSTEQLEQRLAELSQQPRPARRPDLPISTPNAQRGRVAGMRRTKGASEMFSRRIKTVTAVVTIAAVVALFAFLFRGFAGGHSSPTAHPNAGSPTATATAAPAAQATAATLVKNLNALPVVAPSNTQVIYLLVAASDPNPDGKLMLQRSDDGGTSWKHFALPAGTLGDPIQHIVMVSPLDAQHVFLTTTGQNRSGTNGFPACAGALASDGGVGPLAARSGGGPCVAQYASADGGAHWQRLNLPNTDFFIPQALGAPETYSIGTVAQASSTLRAQGQRLYSAMGQVTNVEGGGGLGGGPGMRLITSTDGGLTWSLADRTLVTQVQSICDYAPTPQGSTLFAVTSQGCDSESPQPMNLWQSDDAGAHWSKVGQLPGNTDLGLIAVSGAAGAGPTLYLDATTETCVIGGALAASNGALAATLPQSGSCNLPTAPSDVQVSVDGGKTWKAAPLQGFPGEKQSPGAPLGVLGDGSVLYLDPNVSSPNNSFRAWKGGDSSWHQVGSDIAATVISAQLATGKDGKQMLIVVTNDQSGYAVLAYQV